MHDNGSERRDRRGAVLHISSHATGWKKTTYTADEVDVIAAYSMELDRCFLIPIEMLEQRPTIQLRISPTLNNQKRRINWAEDFDFAARLRPQQGAVAQLGER